MLARLLGLSRAAYQSDDPEPPRDDSALSKPEATSPARKTSPAALPAIISARGSLFYSDPSSNSDSPQEVMYAICDASIHPTSTTHTFSLRISRAPDEPDDDEYPAFVTFPIISSAAFQTAEGGIGWTDEDGKRYHLDLDGEASAEDFGATLARALFESAKGREPGPGDVEEVRAMVKTYEPEETQVRPSDLLTTAGELIRVVGGLYRYDVSEEKFVMLADQVLVAVHAAVVKEDGDRAYLMTITERQTGRQIMESEIDNTLTGCFYTESLSVVWVIGLGEDDGAEDGTQVCLSVKISDSESFFKFREQYSMCLYEVNHQASAEDLKLKDDDREYVMGGERDDIDPMEIDEEVKEEELEERGIREERPGDRAAVEDVDDGMVNGQLAVSANTDRTFVVRGNKMGVFKTGLDGAKHTATIPFTSNGKGFVPSDILLHEGDTSMLLLDPQDDSKLMRMDLERGEIVDTWSGPVLKHNTVSTVHRSTKYANLSTTKEFVGLNKNALLRMDPRTSEFVVQSKNYAKSTRARLDCVATTGAGHLAVASENGDIRLYDQIGKNAKTHLPGLGDRIIGIDVSEDGNYVLATTEKYLLVINTIVKAEKTYSGFSKSMGKHKPTPRKLVIRPEDIVRYRMGDVSFTPAHFNTGRSTLEKSIVTSTGPFLITWNFRAVKLGRLNCYNITRYRDTILADDFAFGDEGRIVMSLPNDVGVARR